MIGLEVPYIFAGAGVDRCEATAALAEEDQASGGGEHAGVVRLHWAGQHNLPDDFTGLNVEGAQNLLGRMGGIE